MTRADRFVCDICEYKATRQTQLTLHIESKHEGIRYGCNICPFKTITNNFLNVHKQFVHEGKRFECNYCDFKNKLNLNLKLHIQRKHNELVSAGKDAAYAATKRFLNGV